MFEMNIMNRVLQWSRLVANALLNLIVFVSYRTQEMGSVPRFYVQVILLLNFAFALRSIITTSNATELIKSIVADNLLSITINTCKITAMVLLDLYEQTPYLYSYNSF